jgi:hypothetical protein
MELCIKVDGPCDGYPEAMHWIPVKITNFPDEKECGSCGKQYALVYVQTAPDLEWSSATAIWVPVSQLREVTFDAG